MICHVQSHPIVQGERFIIYIHLFEERDLTDYFVYLMRKKYKIGNHEEKKVREEKKLIHIYFFIVNIC